MPENSESRKKPSEASTFLCFDFGLRRIGIAIGQSLTGNATALETINNGSQGGPWRRIEQLLERWQPDALVIGIPFTEEGDEQPLTLAARRFGRQLNGRFGLVVHHADERYTSRAADQRFRDLRHFGLVRRKHAARQDAVAAQLILEQWLEQQIAGG
jgi:putative Holliday junction resolvase